MTEAIVSNADLSASCIGGAAQRNSYRQAIEAAGLRVEMIRRNRYEFISASRPPGGSTRATSADTRSLSGEKLMTPFDPENFTPAAANNSASVHVAVEDARVDIVESAE